MFTRIPQIQVRSEETRLLCGGNQILLEEFALAHPARCKERLGRNESNLKGLQVPLRQLGTRKVPRIQFAFWHGWQRLARGVPAGTASTSPCQPNGTREVSVGSPAGSQTRISSAIPVGRSCLKRWRTRENSPAVQASTRARDADDSSPRSSRGGASRAASDGLSR